MNLCMIAPRSSLSGGVSNWEKILSQELCRHREIKVYFINNASTKRPMDGGTIIYRIFHGSYVMFRAYFMLRRFAKKKKIDIVHMTTSGGLGLIRDNWILKYLSKKKISSVYHIHFGRAIAYRNRNGWKWKLLIRAVKNADCTIVIDQKSYRILRSESKKIEYVNNPVNLEEFGRYKITNERKIVYIGWIIKEKGIEELIQAFHRFNAKEEYELELIGPGKREYVEFIQSEYDMSHIHLLGEMKHDDAMCKLAEASFFVLPSYTEGFPNVILEAMALHKPVIASNVGAVPQMLEDGAGIVVEPRDIIGLSDAMRTLANTEKQKEMGEKSYARVFQNYDIKKTFEKYYRIWKETSQNKEEG